MAFVLHQKRTRRVNKEAMAARIVARSGQKEILLRTKPGEPDATARVKLLDAEAGQCRWPYGTTYDTLVCGHPTVNGSSWCKHHYRRCFHKRLHTSPAPTVE